MKPLIANRERKNEAAAWHRAVFSAHGKKCWNCGGEATDACHVIPRSQLGKLRYEMPKENGRPGCRRCHQRQECGELDFPIAVRRAAVRAHNKIARVPMMEP